MWLFKKKKKKPSKAKSYEFSVTDIVSVGDKYKYTVKAKDRKEAFKKLVTWFYSENMGNPDDIKSEHYNISHPSRSYFNVSSMPYWFGRLISGHRGPWWDKLVEYCEKHNIKIREY